MYLERLLLYTRHLIMSFEMWLLFIEIKDRGGYHVPFPRMLS